MNEDLAHSYDHGGDPTELGRLSMQADVAWNLEKQQLLKVGISADSRVVDVGCGPGLLSRRIASLVPYGSVIGVDADDELLDRARQGARDSQLDQVSFVKAWASEMPLPTASADLAYARFLLQHVPDPAAVVFEMTRVVAPGGQVMIVDTDDAGIMMHPEPAGLSELLDASKAGQARLGGDRHIGRKLSSLLTEAGLESVELRVVPFTADLVGAEAWAQICLGFKTRLIHPDRMSEEEVEAVLEETLRCLHTPGAFAQSLVYVAVGTVPESDTVRL